MNRGQNARRLIELAVDVAHRRNPVSKHYVAGLFNVHHRTALRYLHSLHEANLLEPIGVMDGRGGSALVYWKASFYLRQLLGVKDADRPFSVLPSPSPPILPAGVDSSGSREGDPGSTPA